MQPNKLLVHPYKTHPPKTTTETAGYPFVCQWPLCHFWPLRADLPPPTNVRARAVLLLCFRRQLGSELGLRAPIVQLSRLKNQHPILVMTR
jgi:hypothetical protein